MISHCNNMFSSCDSMCFHCNYVFILYQICFHIVPQYFSMQADTSSCNQLPPHCNERRLDVAANTAPIPVSKFLYPTQQILPQFCTQILQHTYMIRIASNHVSPQEHRGPIPGAEYCPRNRSGILFQYPAARSRARISPPGSIRPRELGRSCVAPDPDASNRTRDSRHRSPATRCSVWRRRILSQYPAARVLYYSSPPGSL